MVTEDLTAAKSLAAIAKLAASWNLNDTHLAAADPAVTDLATTDIDVWLMTESPIVHERPSLFRLHPAP